MASAGVPGLSATPGQAARVLDRLQRVVQVRRGLDVDGDRVRARLGERLDVVLGALDHQVDVDLGARPRGPASAIASTTSGPIVIGGTKWPSITSTWMTGAPASSTVCDLLAEAAEVGGQDRRGDAFEHG